MKKILNIIHTHTIDIDLDGSSKTSQEEEGFHQILLLQVYPQMTIMEIQYGHILCYSYHRMNNAYQVLFWIRDVGEDWIYCLLHDQISHENQKKLSFVCFCVRGQ